jgi:lysine 2,3-aminomutase
MHGDDEVDAGLGGGWRRQLEGAFRAPDDLPREYRGGLDPAEAGRAAARFPMRVTPYYLSLVDPDDPDDPLARMAFPDGREIARGGTGSHDPISEEEHSPVPGLIRRYPDRAVLLVSGACAVNCRHCTRRHLGRGRLAPLGRDGLDAALGYLAGHPEVRDVILSGGDPLLLEDGPLTEIVSRVRAIPSVEIVRIGTRVPVTLPMRVSRDLARRLAGFGPLYLSTQFNHPRELTGEARRALDCFVDAGVPVANQAVLLRGVNDSGEIMEELCRALLRARVRPYYLFLCDQWVGLDHLRTGFDEGLEVMAHLRGRLSGLGIPQLVVDLPGGIGKVPVGPEYVVSREAGRTLLRAPDGREAEYVDPLEG